MNAIRHPALILSALALALPAAVAAQNPAASAELVAAPALALAPAPADVLRGELRSAIVRVMESGAFAGTEPEQVALSLTLPAERYVDLGLVLDSRADTAVGVPVLGTSAGGIAPALGVRAGDVITAIDGAPLTGLGRDDNGRSRAVESLRAAAANLREGNTLTLTLRRDGREQTLSGPVRARFIPAVRLELGEGALVASISPAAAVARSSAALPAQAGGCGRISVFHIAPRSQSLYPAKILSIDGEIPGPAFQDTYRVSPGPHTLEVAEQIDVEDIPQVYSRARRHATKELVVDVEPGVTYMVSSRFNKDRRYGFGDRSYWSPVVWKEVPEGCD